MTVNGYDKSCWSVLALLLLLGLGAMWFWLARTQAASIKTPQRTPRLSPTKPAPANKFMVASASWQEVRHA
jgi:hypothetical protein